jgi:hypothetical protein
MRKLLAIVGAFIAGGLAIVSTATEAAARLSLN